MKKLFTILALFSFLITGTCWAIIVAGSHVGTGGGVSCGATGLMTWWPTPDTTNIETDGGCGNGDVVGTWDQTGSFSGGWMVQDANDERLEFDAYATGGACRTDWDTFGNETGTIFMRWKYDTYVASAEIWDRYDDLSNYMTLRITGADEAVDLIFSATTEDGANPTATADCDLSSGTAYWIRASWQFASTPYLYIECFNDSGGSKGSSIASANDSSLQPDWGTGDDPCVISIGGRNDNLQQSWNHIEFHSDYTSTYEGPAS